VYWQSIPGIYLAACLQEVLSGLYEPSRSAIVPLLVPDAGDDLEKATILTGVAWSLMAAVGAASGGFLVACFGTRGCFIIDSATYVISALLMALIPGNFNVSSSSSSSAPTTSSIKSPASETHDPVTESSASSTLTSSFSLSLLVSTIRGMIIDGISYLCNSFFGALVFVKFTIMLLTLDVVNVSFAERHAAAAAANVNANTLDDDDDDRDKTPIYLGFLFCAIGVGCLLGPVVAERFTDMNRPITLQVACLLSIALSSLMCLVMSIPGIPFWLLCILTGTRAIGVSTAWIDATLLLQKFAAPHMLGRVLSLDYALALMAESSSAMMAGRVQDVWGWTPEQVCRLLGSLGCIQLSIWIIYHVRGGGAASAEAANTTSTTGANQGIATEVAQGADVDNNDVDEADSEQVAFL
jgi:MFS family permease